MVNYAVVITENKKNMGKYKWEGKHLPTTQKQPLLMFCYILRHYYWESNTCILLYKALLD